MSEYDKSYYRARGATERGLAAAAANPKVAAIHLEWRGATTFSPRSGPWPRPATSSFSW